MILVVDPHSGVPVYRQIVEQIRYSAVSGLLEPGEEVPSTRVLSAKLGVNPMTVSKAFGLLEAEGVLERRPGRPHVVKPRRGRKQRASQLAQLEEAMQPVAKRVHELELDAETALQVLRRLLEQDER